MRRGKTLYDHLRKLDLNSDEAMEVVSAQDYLFNAREAIDFRQALFDLGYRIPTGCDPGGNPVYQARPLGLAKSLEILRSSKSFPSQSRINSGR